MSIHSLPKNGLVLIKEKSNGIGPLVFSMTHGDRNCVIHFAAAEAWMRQFFDGCMEKCSFVSFDSEVEVDYACLENAGAKNLIFADFDIYCEVFGTARAFQLVDRLRRANRLFVSCPTTIDDDVYLRLASLAVTTFSIESASDDDTVFAATSTSFDKKGRFTNQEEEMDISENGKLKCNKIKKEKSVDVEMNDFKAAFELDQIKETEKAAKDALTLPYMQSRMEDGVAIRDATKKKIRVGGQIIYEPDHADDLDDSDPDDDLNI